MSREIDRAEQGACELTSVCRMLDKLGIGGDPDWLALVLFVRNIVPKMSLVDEAHKAEFQKMVFKSIQDKRFDGERFLELLRSLEIGIRDHYQGIESAEADQFEREKLFSNYLMQEMSAILGDLKQIAQHREDSVSNLGESTIEALKGGADLKSIVGHIRGMVQSMVHEIRDEARMWEMRASALERTALFDPLLGMLYNRRAFDPRLRECVERCAEDGAPLSLVFIDVDHFKDVNDQYGHLVGDDVLKSLGKIVKDESDKHGCFAARYGGEELALICDGLTLMQADTLAENIRYQVASYEFRPRRHEEGGDAVIHFTVSLGVACHRAGWSAPDLIKAADTALYDAKRSGRNLVCTYTEALPPL